MFVALLLVDDELDEEVSRLSEEESNLLFFLEILLYLENGVVLFI